MPRLSLCNKDDVETHLLSSECPGLRCWRATKQCGAPRAASRPNLPYRAVGQSRRYTALIDIATKKPGAGG